MLKISIITCTLNSERFLEFCIQSVLNASYKNLEHLIIDGGSTDNTLQIAKKNIPANNIYSQRDSGIADAMNRGLLKATGDLIYYLHSDDTLISNSLHLVNDIFLKEPHLQWLYGRVDLINQAGDFMDTMIDKPISIHSLLLSHVIFHQSVFMKTQFLRDLGGFDDKYKVRMDHELWFRAIKKSIPKRTNITVAKFRVHSNSTSIKQLNQSTKEHVKIYNKYKYLGNIDIFTLLGALFLNNIQSVAVRYKSRFWYNLPRRLKNMLPILK